MIPEVTIDDLASFRPPAPHLLGEPAGFGVAGLPVNFVADSAPHAASGDLLGWNATVTFSPAGFVFDHGDGTRSRSASGGAPWSALGVPSFTATSTSHVYRDPGQYTARAIAQFRASVDFGSGVVRDVPGLVSAVSGDYGIRVVEARTALVDRTCAEAPRGPGC